MITGLGAVTPLGLAIDTIWEKLCQGVSGIGKITRFDAHEYSAQIAGEVRDFTPEHYIDKRDLRRMDRFVHYAMAASQEAIQDAGLSLTESMADRVGVYIGTAFGGLESLEAVHRTLLEKGPNRVSPLFPAMVLGNLASGHVSMRFGATGPNNSSVTACAAGAHSIGEAFHTIVRGAADVMITGGTEAVITPLALVGVAGVGGGAGFMSSRGTANLLTRTTAVLAVGFFLTSLFLSWYASYDRKPSSIIDANPATQSQPAGPATPVSPPTSGGILDSLKKSDERQQNQPQPSGPQAPRSQ